jgi:hypothetical protein
MPDDTEPQNPQPSPPSGSGGGGTPEPPSEPITIPPKWVTYSEPDIGVSIDMPFDLDIKTGRE